MTKDTDSELSIACDKGHKTLNSLSLVTKTLTHFVCDTLPISHDVFSLFLLLSASFDKFFTLGTQKNSFSFIATYELKNIVPPGFKDEVL